MNLYIHFNFPPGENSAFVEMGFPSAEDERIEFRAGVVLEDDCDKIFWHKAGWVPGNEIFRKINFNVKKGDKVVVERRLLGHEGADTRNIWDINDEWLANVSGSNTVIAHWCF